MEYVLEWGLSYRIILIFKDKYFKNVNMKRWCLSIFILWILPRAHIDSGQVDDGQDPPLLGYIILDLVKLIFVFKM